MCRTQTRTAHVTNSHKNIRTPDVTYRCGSGDYVIGRVVRGRLRFPKKKKRISAFCHFSHTPQPPKPPETMSKALTITAVAATALIGYAAYFDYNRRNSAEFRKALKAKEIKHKKKQAKAKEINEQDTFAKVKEALNAIEASSIPTDISEKEAFFMQQVSMGEQLASLPDQKLEAALCFYKGLTVYPNPTDILGIYQRTVPEDVYELIVMMIATKPPATVATLLGNNSTESKPSAGDLD